MKITVAICTWNRCEMLRSTLSSLARGIHSRQLDWEVIVVNNNSDDDTNGVVASFRDLLPIRVIFEAKPGVSNARNAAVVASNGDYVIWADDDVVMSEGWLAEYAGAFWRHPEAAVFGGPIIPHFEVDPPTWLAAGIGSVAEAFGIRGTGDDESEIVADTNQFPFGANFAVRRAELAEIPFDTSIGRSPGSAFLGGEEIGVIKGILTSGHTGWWVPRASLAHRIRAEQMRLSYIKKYYVGVGRWMSLADEQEKFSELLGVPSWMLREAAVRELARMALRPFQSRSAALAELKTVCILRGRLLAAWQRNEVASVHQRC